MPTASSARSDSAIFPELLAFVQEDGEIAAPGS